jgi:hypothetical protein
MIEWWTKLEANMQVGLIQFGGAVLTALIGFLVVAWQVDAQARKSRDLAVKNASDAIKLDIYKEAVEITSAANEAIRNALGVVDGHIRELDLASQQPSPNIDAIKGRWAEFLSSYTTALNRSVAVIYLVEQWQSVDPRLLLFRRAIGARHHEIHKVFWPLSRLLMRTMPCPLPGTNQGYFPWQLPLVTKLSELKALKADYDYEFGLLSAYILDYQNELQQILVAPLFDNDVERRDPPDPRQFAIRLDRYEEVDDMLSKTEWGELEQQLEMDAWARFADDHGRHDKSFSPPRNG